MNEEQILKERKTVKRTVIKDEAVEVVIKIFDEVSDILKGGAKSESKPPQDIQLPTDAKEKSNLHEQKAGLEVEQKVEQKTIEISIIKPTFQERVEIEANVISKIEIPEYRDILKYVHLIRFQTLKSRDIEVKDIALELEILETNTAKALRSVLKKLIRPEFEKPGEVSIIRTNTIIPKIESTTQNMLKYLRVPKAITSVKPSEVKIKAIETVLHARSAAAPPLHEEITIAGFEDPIKNLFGSGGFKVLSERPIIILAEKPKDKSLEYIEFLKRILREIYRTRAKGLPTSAHISTDFEEIKLDIKAGKSIYVIDLDNIELKKRDRQYLSDRIKELYSQNFGFVVLYGSRSSIKTTKYLWMPDIRGGFEKLPDYIEVTINEDKKTVFTFANLFWGKIERYFSDIPVNLDEYIMKLEQIFYSKIEEVANDLKLVLIIEPSKEDEEGIEGESIIHYGTKAFIVNYLTKFEDVPIENITTEFEFGDAIIDVFVKHPEHGDLAIEVETLFGTTIPILKLRKRIESRLEKGLKTWIVIPNPQFMTYFREISALRSHYRKRYHDFVEFWTLDIKSNKLISFKELTTILSLNNENREADVFQLQNTKK